MDYFWQKVKELLKDKVDVAPGMGLSANNYTAAEKTKLAGIAAGAEVNVNADWNATSGDAEILHKPTIPSKLSDLTNDGNFVQDANYTHITVDSAMSDSSTNPVQNSVLKDYVDSAIGSGVGVSFEVVQLLPSTGSAGTIYLVPNSGSGTNIYDEYIYVNNAFEKIGTTDVDLSGYSTAANWKNGSATGSVRTSGSAAEDSNYTIGSYAVAEGHSSKASGESSHAEGEDTLASGDYSHAEGGGGIAGGICSHVEGGNFEALGLQAYGKCSHAEGCSTAANGDYAHSAGRCTIAQRKSQTVVGEYNIADTGGTGTTARGDYVFIVGNGTAHSNRSNALTVDWLGNVNIPSGAKYKTNGTALSASDVGAQETLVSGTNIKTINNNSLLGSGDLQITSGVSDVQVDGSSVVTSGVAAIPVGTAIDLGVVKVPTANGLSITNGDVSIDRATTSDFGVVKVTKGNGLAISESGSGKGTISMGRASYSIPGAVLPDTSNGLTYNSSSGIVSTDATATPTASTIAKFDSSAHINSEDMTSQEVEDFVDDIIGELTSDSKFAAISSSELYDLETALGITHAQASILYNILDSIVTRLIAREAQMNWGTWVNITSYDSNSNYYTCPSDGLLQLRCNYRQGSYAMVTLQGGSTVYAQISGSGNANNAGNSIIVVPIFKGWKLFCTTSNTYCEVYFIPLNKGF